LKPIDSNHYPLTEKEMPVDFAERNEECADDDQDTARGEGNSKVSDVKKPADKDAWEEEEAPL
jgi:hypothetical protein